MSLLVFFSALSSAASGGEKLSPGSQLPELTLNSSDAPDSAGYLGIRNRKSFSAWRLPAKFVLIEIFSMYCPICHKQAPAMNRIHRIIEQDPEMSREIKVLGIGAGNNLKEIEVFKSKLHVSFPLFTDSNFSIHKKLGEPRTPFIILASSKGRVLLTHTGEIKDFDEFLGMLKKACGYR